jgi:hypothetical protein
MVVLIVFEETQQATLQVVTSTEGVTRMITMLFFVTRPPSAKEGNVETTDKEIWVDKDGKVHID